MFDKVDTNLQYESSPPGFTPPLPRNKNTESKFK